MLLILFMFIKREGGYVFAVLALFVFSGFLVSAEYYTQEVFSGSSVHVGYFKVFPVSSPMVGYNITVSVKTTAGICPVYIDYNYNTGLDTEDTQLVNANSSQILTFSQVGFDTTRVVKNITIRTGQVVGCTGNLNVTSIYLQGKYYNASVNDLVVPIPSEVPNPLKLGDYASLLAFSKPLVVTNLSVTVTNLKTTACTLSAVLYDSQGAIISSPKINAVSIPASASNILKYAAGVPANNLQVAPLSYRIALYSSCDLALRVGQVSVDGFYPDGAFYSFSSTCTFAYSEWGNCVNNLENRTVTANSPSGCTGGSPVLTRSCGLESCFTRCAQNGTLSAAAPYTTNSMSSCEYRQSCGNILIQRASALNIIWQYNYSDGSSESVCSCNETSSVDNHITYVSSASGVYPLPVNISDDNQKVLSKVGVYILGVGENNKTASVSKIINVEYGCTNYCNGVGLKKAVFSGSSGQTNRYRTCEKMVAPNNFCFNWTNEVFTCPVGNKFDNVTGECVFSQANDCNGQRFFCSDKAVSFGNAEVQLTPSLLKVNCSLSTETCFRCNVGYHFDSSRGNYGLCVKSDCVNNCTSSGGLCSVTGGNNLAENNSYTCCTDESCYMCASGYHAFNNTCVSNNCTGILPQGFNFTKGANSTSNISVFMNWTFVNGPVGACQWNCSIGFRNNTRLLCDKSYKIRFNNFKLGFSAMLSTATLQLLNETDGVWSTVKEDVKIGESVSLRDIDIFINGIDPTGHIVTASINEPNSPRGFLFDADVNDSVTVSECISSSSCILGLPDCISELKGTCGNLSLAGSAHALNGNCSIGTCFACNTSSVLINGTCVSSTDLSVCISRGLISNGVQCVENKDCGSGKCRFLTKNGKTTCVQTGFSFKEENKVYFCDVGSTFKSSLSVGSECNFNSQCETNFCFRNQTAGKSFCFNLNQASGLREFFIDFVCWFQNMGNANARAQCKSAKMAEIGTAQLGLGNV